VCCSRRSGDSPNDVNMCLYFVTCVLCTLRGLFCLCDEAVLLYCFVAAFVVSLYCIRLLYCLVFHLHAVCWNLFLCEMCGPVQ